MPQAWGKVAIAVAAATMAALPLVALLSLPVPGKTGLVSIGTVCLAFGFAIGWKSRPGWLAFASWVGIVVSIVLAMKVTVDPCPPDVFCEGFPPEAQVMLAGVIVIWPGQALGLASAGLIRYLRHETVQDMAEGVRSTWLKQFLSLALLVVGGLVLGWLTLGALQ